MSVIAGVTVIEAVTVTVTVIEAEGLTVNVSTQAPRPASNQTVSVIHANLLTSVKCPLRLRSTRTVHQRCDKAANATLNRHPESTSTAFEAVPSRRQNGAPRDRLYGPVVTCGSRRPHPGDRTTRRESQDQPSAWSVSSSMPK